MRRVLIPIFVLSTLYMSLEANDNLVTLKGDRNRQFLIDNTDSRELNSLGHSKRVYYLYGIKSDSTQFIDTREIILELKSGTDRESFQVKNGLKFVKKIGKRAVYRVIDDSEIVSKSNYLRELNSVISVSPNWIRDRRLK